MLPGYIRSICSENLSTMRLMRTRVILSEICFYLLLQLTMLLVHDCFQHLTILLEIAFTDLMGLLVDLSDFQCMIQSFLISNRGRRYVLVYI